jgi:luciferase family oxidoreductase group 1
MPGSASSAPAVLIAHLADATTSALRVGPAALMLPNHAPLVIAEQFGMLEALHPGRIDLGIGRAPGTDKVTAYALRRHLDPSAEDLPTQLAELRAFFAGTSRASGPSRRAGYEPELWLLGSSDFSARLAGELGLPFSFAHHFMPQNTLPRSTSTDAASARRERSRSPTRWSASRSVCAETTSRRAGCTCLGAGRSCGCAADAGHAPVARGGGGARDLHAGERDVRRPWSAHTSSDRRDVRAGCASCRRARAPTS